MIRQYRAAIGSLALLVLLPGMFSACATVSSTLGAAVPDFDAVPEEHVREAAREIEAAVAAGEREPDISGSGGVMLDTPEIKQAIRARAARYDAVQELLDKGYAREGVNGHIYIIRNRAYKEATTRYERDRNALIVSGEGESRWAIYEGIRKASNMSPRALSAIQRIFYEERLYFLKPGHKYETIEGETAVKSAGS
jgi:hypothetical protein